MEVAFRWVHFTNNGFRRVPELAMAGSGLAIQKPAIFVKPSQNHPNFVGAHSYGQLGTFGSVNARGSIGNSALSSVETVLEPVRYCAANHSVRGSTG